MRKFHLFQGATQIIPTFSPCQSMYYLDISTTNPLSHRDGNGGISRAQELTQNSSAMSDPKHWETRPIISMNLLKKQIDMIRDFLLVSAALTILYSLHEV